MICNIDDVLANSYRDFHAKGVDYICLRRSPSQTMKLYSFSSEAAAGSDVVNPHDHRYDFKTTVLSGQLTNKLYVPARGGAKFYRHNYKTPLNGGGGFAMAGSTFLQEQDPQIYGEGEQCDMLAEQIHTIQVGAGTVLLLDQSHDRDIEATSTYTKGLLPPKLEGLYRRFREGELIAALMLLSRVIGADLSVHRDSFHIDLKLPPVTARAA